MTYTNQTGGTICLNADKSAVVDCAAPEAAWVLVGPGGELPDAVAAEYGLEPGGTPDPKARRPVEDKAVAPADDKATPAPTVPRRR